jgi:hypothetical protein
MACIEISPIQQLMFNTSIIDNWQSEFTDSYLKSCVEEEGRAIIMAPAASMAPIPVSSYPAMTLPKSGYCQWTAS